MSITASSVNDILKEDYGPDGIANTAYEENPGFGMVKKHRMTGAYYRYPVQYGYASNRSHTASNALAKTNTTNFIHFNVPTVEDYDAKSLQKKAMEEAQDPGAFVELLRNVCDSVVKSLANNCGADFFNHRGATVGQISATSAVATPTITLSDPTDITKFYAGQTLAASTANGLSGALKGGSVTVLSVDRSAGTVTATGNWSAGIATVAVNDFLFPAGDFGLGRAGLADWCPDTTTGLGTAFYTAVRSVDASRLAGSRATVTGLPVSQAIRQLGAIMGREEGKPDTYLCSWTTMNDLMTERDIKLIHTRVDAQGMDATVGFDSVRVIGVRGPIDVVADRSCNDGHGYLVRMTDLVCIHSQDTPVKIDDADGSMMIRESTDFTYDIRGAAFVNYGCLKPLNLGVMLF
jgi:hypothetical protein